MPMTFNIRGNKRRKQKKKLPDDGFHKFEQVVVAVTFGYLDSINPTFELITPRNVRALQGVHGALTDNSVA